jgi:hypothetical protein
MFQCKNCKTVNVKFFCEERNENELTITIFEGAGKENDVTITILSVK